MKRTVYLDYAAATPVDERVADAMEPYLVHKFHNPSATYLAAQDVSKDLQAARALVAVGLGIRPVNITFTAGGTEANNLAIKGVLYANPGTHAVSTALEHDSIRAPLAFMVGQGWSHTEVAPKPDGVVDPSDIIAAVTDKTVLVSVMYANNEIGTIQPLRRIAAGLEAIRKTRRANDDDLPLYLHTDACQAANYLDIHAHRLGVDMMTLNGGKIYGPKQSGILYAANHVRLLPIIHGGGQERNMRSGTENVSGAIGFARALELAQAGKSDETARLNALQERFIRQLEKSVPSARINGSLKHRLPNNIHMTIPGADNERLLFQLDGRGIQCATGSACSASKAESSHCLRAIGLTDDEARASLRFSMGRGTSAQDVDYAVRTLAETVAR